jgi:hypothetical protein
MDHIFCIHSSVEGNLIFSGFSLLRIKKASVNLVDHMSLCYGTALFGYMPMNGTAGSWSRAIFNFLKNYQIDFSNCCINFFSHQKWKSVSLVLHPWQHVLLLEFLILIILTGVRWNLRVRLIYISLTRMLNISSWSFQVPLLSIVCLDLYLIL